MLIPVITAVLLAGILVVLLRVDVGIHRSESQLERIASALEGGASKTLAGDKAANSQPKTDYEEIAAAIAAARIALNEKKRSLRPAQSAAAASASKPQHVYDGRSNGLVDVFNEEIGTDKGNKP